MPDLSVLVVTFECRDWARQCLASVYETAGDVDLEVVVLDNASSDGTAEMVRTEFPQARLLAEESNLGFARGVNRAAAEARGDALLLLNPDVIVHPGTIENLLAFAAAHPELGIYGGRTLRLDGTVDPSSCWAQPTPWSLFCFATMLTTAFKRSRVFDPESMGRWERDTPREVGIVTGCLLLVSRTTWRELGGFDERFFMYGEDADLALRARKAGLRPAITPDAVVTHEVGASSRRRPDKMTLVLRSKATLIRKHWSPVPRFFGLAMLWVGAGLRALLSRLVGRRWPEAPAWRDVWKARRRWLAGYGPAGDALLDRVGGRDARSRV